MLARFIANPGSFNDGIKERVAEGLSGPATEVGKEAASNANWTVVFMAGIGVFGGEAAWKAGWRRVPRGGVA